MLFGGCKHYIKKSTRRMIAVALGLFIFMMGTIGYSYFNAAHIQYKIKQKVCASVLKYEENLLKTVEECKSNKADVLISYKTQDDSAGFLYYKKLNSETMNEVFKIFRLWYIETREDEIVRFSILPTIQSLLWSNYECGFYYTKEDKAVDVIWGGECNGEIEGIIPGIGKYWYKTEQIDDNWWFYESKSGWNK